MIPAPAMSASATPADPLVARWLRRELAVHPPNARSLVVTIWGDALAPHGGEVWLASLIRLLAPFAINERLVRTSVFRLARDGWLAAQTTGRRSRYRLIGEGAARFAQAYRRVYTPPSHPWDGRWEVVVVPPESMPAKQRLALRNELAWSGFGTFAPGVHARPGVEGEAFVLQAHAVTGGVLRMDAQDVPNGDGGTLAGRVDAAWPLRELAADYRRFIARFARVVEAFRSPGTPSPEQAFLVRSLLVHEYRRTRLRDPQLPADLLPLDWPGAAAYALCRDFYRRAHPLALRYLASTFADAGETLPPPLPAFDDRFAR